jgi:hypothetical protein
MEASDVFEISLSVEVIDVVVEARWIWICLKFLQVWMEASDGYGVIDVMFVLYISLVWDTSLIFTG